MQQNGLGSKIYELRKKKGVTQDELGKAVGVTMQAVSKWECGSTPDAELLPALADYLGVTIDTLFGRTNEIRKDIEKAIIYELRGLDPKERFKKAFRYCWGIQQGVSFAPSSYLKSYTLQNEKNIPEDLFFNEKIDSTELSVYSRITFGDGRTLMRMNEAGQYFFMMPFPKDGFSSLLLSAEEYEDIFKFLGQPNIMKTLMFLYGRAAIGVTAKLLVKYLSVSLETAEEVLELLYAKGFINRFKTETDDKLMISYMPHSNDLAAPILPFLYFTSEIMDRRVLTGLCTTDIDIPVL
jgi:transcriptional regulator with XRE-family HTH domain/DNA-binding MarR family transcriptional regulator